MAIVEPLESGADGRRRLGIRRPSDREPVGEITVQTANDVADAVIRARKAQKAWGARPVAERAAIIRKGVEVLYKRREEVTGILMNETGKTRLETIFLEIIAGFDFINYWSARAEKELADEKRKIHGYLRPFKKLLMHYRPLGVVGIITPWNGPFSLAMNPSVQALLAGNAIILKPSEVAPYSGEIAIKILHEAGVPEDVAQVLHGDGETGAALVNAGVQKISFTGSVGTGKKIAVACAQQLIPCTLELGGKDAMIVCADADLERAAGGALFGSFVNSGHVCMGVERVYVVEAVADEFERILEEKVKQVRYGRGENTDMGPVFWDKQLTIIERHIADAKKRGASILVGGEADLDKGLFFKPTLVTNVDHSMELMTDETFGPIVAVMRVKDEEEAIRLANDSPYGLSGSVWTDDNEKGIEIAKRLDTGSVMINDASLAYGITEAPFSGMKDSGLGSANGLGALRSYTFPQPIIVDRWKKSSEEHWYPHNEQTDKAMNGLVDYVYGTRLHKLKFFT